MRIRVSHQVIHRFDPPARTVNQILRLTPLSFDSQYVLRWRVDIDADGARRETEDAHGNAVTSYSHYGPIERVTISAVGEVETSDAAGVVRGAAERLPPEMYLRDSPLAQVNGALRAFAAEATQGAADPLDSMHRLMDALHEALPHHPDEKDAAGSAIEAFALRRGTGARFRPCLHRLRALARDSGALRRRLSRRRRVRARRARMNGPRPIFRTSAGSASMRPFPSVRTTAMSGSPSASTPRTAR